MGAPGTTPGPWVAEDDLVRAAPNRLVVGVMDPGGTYRPKLSTREIRANAHQMAASGALYDQLLRAIEMLEGYETYATGETFNDTAMNAALAQARGESS